MLNFAFTLQISFTQSQLHICQRNIRLELKAAIEFSWNHKRQSENLRNPNFVNFTCGIGILEFFFICFSPRRLTGFFSLGGYYRQHQTEGDTFSPTNHNKLKLPGSHQSTLAGFCQKLTIFKKKQITYLSLFYNLILLSGKCL